MINEERTSFFSRNQSMICYSNRRRFFFRKPETQLQSIEYLIHVHKSIIFAHLKEQMMIIIIINSLVYTKEHYRKRDRIFLTFLS